MPEKLEAIMKKFHIYLANCKESAYSSEDVIVSKKRIFTLLEELNQAVYEASEQYEASQEAKTRGLMNAERQAAEIKEEALSRADDIYAASMVYMNDAVTQIKNSLEYTYLKVRREYEELVTNYEDKIKELNSNAEEIRASLSQMAEAQKYLKLIEEINERNNSADKPVPEKKPAVKSKLVGSVESVETLAVPEGEKETDPADSTVRIEVHDAPKMAEISSKGKKKKESIMKLFQKGTKPSGESDEVIEINEEAISEEY